MKPLTPVIIFSIFIFNYTPCFAQDYYRSNSIGMVFEKISSFRINDIPWVIELSKTGKLETRIIYFEGEENKRLEYFREDNSMEISEYVSNELVKTVTKVDGLVVKEEKYKNGVNFNTFLYEWSGQMLQKATYFEDDIHIYEDLFIIENNGRLKQIRRIFDQNELRISGFGYSDKGINSEWHETDGEASLYKYENGKVLLIENWQDGELVRTKTFTPTDSGRFVLESDLLTGTIVEFLYDPDDKLLMKKTRAGNNIEKSLYYYNENLLVEKTVSSPGIRKKHLFYYNSDKSLHYEEIINSGILTKEIFYTSGKKDIVKVYRDNSLILMVFYKDGEEIREERIR